MLLFPSNTSNTSNSSNASNASNASNHSIPFPPGPIPPETCLTSAAMATKCKEQLIFGTILTLVGTTLNALALIVQKLAHNHNAGLPKDRRRPYVFQARWQLGFWTFTAGQVINAVSLAYLPQSIAATLGNVGLFANLLFARCLLGERIQRIHYVGNLLIIAGCVLVVFNAPTPAGGEDYSVEALITNFTHTPFIVFACTLVSLIVSIVAVIYVKKRRQSGPSSPLLYAGLSATMGCVSYLFTKVRKNIRWTNIVDRTYDRRSSREAPLPPVVCVV